MTWELSYRLLSIFVCKFLRLCTYKMRTQRSLSSKSSRLCEATCQRYAKNGRCTHKSGKNELQKVEKNVRVAIDA